MPVENGTWFTRLALLGAVLGLCLIMLGAFVRLSDAGLGCPDWPVCYGHLAWPTEEAHIEQANEMFPERPVEIEKAWKEQVHRFLAAALGWIVFALALMANWRAPLQRNLLLLAAGAAAAGIVTYVKGWIPVASILSLLSILLPLYGMFAWRRTGWRGRYTAGLLALIIVQAMLGMWTVTLLVKPIIVTAHLLGGMATFALTWLLWLRDRGAPKVNDDDRYGSLRKLAYAALGVLVLQIFLGGWTSTNYAALACPDFPTCQTQWVPPMNFAEGFDLWRGLGVDYEGGVLGNDARVAVHYTHRLGAMLVLLVVGSLVFAIRRRTRQSPRQDDATLRVLGAAAGVFLILQILLGISVVKFGLPLWLAVAHNGGAALLLASLTTLGYALQPSRD
ncbi:MAG TPA: COX15/CtaA family protein [Gammaproteobacteria bacterium]